MYDQYEDLANAIIIEAAKDIRKGNQYAEDAKNFLKSDWCYMLTKIDGRMILSRLEKETNTRRKC